LSARPAVLETRDAAARAPAQGALSGVMLWVAIGAAALGSAVRALTCLNDLWFDEVWTLDLLREHVHSSLDVFTSFKHSNNNHLSSLWMWWLGPEAWWPLYRLPSLLASVGTIGLAGLIAGRWGRLEACVAVTLASASYLLIHFGGEARGYSAVICCALLAWYALLCFDERRSWRWAGVYWLAVVLGFMAHLEFVVCALGIAAWTLWRCLFRAPTRRQGVVDLLRLHALPAALVLLFYGVALRGMELGGGEAYDLVTVLVQTASYALGGPASGELARVAAFAMVAAGAAALVWLARRSDQWLFYGLAIAAPLVLLGITRPEQLYPRYFVVSVALYLVLVAPALAALLRGGTSSKVFGIALLGLFALGNALRVDELVRFGRGQYLEALRFMEQHSGGRELSLGSDHPLRNPTLVNYYARYLEHPDRVRHVDIRAQAEQFKATGQRSEGPEWMIDHRFDLPADVPHEYQDGCGNRYQLVAVYRYSDLSGWHWLVCHNLNRPSVAPAEPLYR